MSAVKREQAIRFGNIDGGGGGGLVGMSARTGSSQHGFVSAVVKINELSSQFSSFLFCFHTHRHRDRQTNAGHA